MIQYLHKKKRDGFSWNILQNIYNGLKIIFNDYKIIIRLIMIDVFTILVYSLRVYIAAKAFYYQIPLLFFYLVAPVALLSIITSITPGGLVIREALIGIFAAWMEINISESVIASILDRAVSMVLIFILGILFNFYLSKKLYHES